MPHPWAMAIGGCAKAVGWRLRRLPAAEEGTIAQLSLLAIMGCVLAIGLLGNVARVTHEKVEVQNGADATAHAAALWHARGLNAVTATNHLMGELTALCVLHEALGGPELDLNETYSPDELRKADQAIEDTQKETISSEYLFFDSSLIETIQQEMGGGGETKVGGSLYDARLTLKEWVRLMFIVKQVAFVLEKIPYTKPIGIALHVAASAVLIKCLVEWTMLEGVELAARTMSIPKQIVQDKVLKILSEYQRRIAEDDPASQKGPLEKSITRASDSLDQANRLKSFVFRAPLPIMEEPKPDRNGPAGELDSRSIPTDSISAIRELDQVIERVGPVIKAFNKIADLIDQDTVPIPDLPIPPLAEPEVSAGNPTKKKYEALEADWNTETKTQWTRATFPWVHAGRAKLIGLFNQETMLTFSRMPTFYGHWTNRLAVAKAYECRSGERMGRGSQERYAMHLLIRREGESKGQEWWRDEAGSRDAEQFFTVMGFSERPVQPLFSPSVFGTSSFTQYCASQAIFYNANSKDKDHLGGDGRQPIIAWDTLNWRPGADIAEYGRPPREASGNLGDFAEALLGRDFSNPPPIKLNWQAKLVPMTRSRLQDALRSSRLEGELRESLEKMSNTMRRLNTH